MKSKLHLHNLFAIQWRRKQLYEQENRVFPEQSKEDIMLSRWALDEYRNATELAGKYIYDWVSHLCRQVIKKPTVVLLEGMTDMFSFIW